jgi:hypothetical protein
MALLRIAAGLSTWPAGAPGLAHGIFQALADDLTPMRTYVPMLEYSFTLAEHDPAKALAGHQPGAPHGHA